MARSSPNPFSLTWNRKHFLDSTYNLFLSDDSSRTLFYYKTFDSIIYEIDKLVNLFVKVSTVPTIFQSIAPTFFITLCAL